MKMMVTETVLALLSLVRCLSRCCALVIFEIGLELRGSRPHIHPQSLLSVLGTGSIWCGRLPLHWLIDRLVILMGRS